MTPDAQHSKVEQFKKDIRKQVEDAKAFNPMELIRPTLSKVIGRQAL